MTYASRTARLLPLLGAFIALTPGCNPPIVPVLDGGNDAGFGLPDGSVPCTSAADCDDHIACTSDTCLPGIMVCAHSVDHTRCDDNIFCNGRELCDTTMGCTHTVTHETCDDSNVCTIDRCIEASMMCEHLPRDLDEDGDSDFNCMGGTDCDDRDPTRSGLAPELCDDFIDNDCDGVIDESNCGRPPHDTCDDALVLAMSGMTMLAVGGATADYTVTCDATSSPDVVASFTLTEPHDVLISADGEFDVTTVALRTTCTDRTTELDCDENFPGTIRRRSMPAGTYFVIIQSGGNVTLDLELTDPTPPPTNETCATPIVIPATGGHYTGSFVGVNDDLTLSCNAGTAGDLVYQIDLAAESDLSVTLTSPVGSQTVYWSVQTTCGTAASELRCQGGQPSDGTLHQLAAGTYFIVIEGPSFTAVDYSLTVAVTAPTARVPGDLCSDAIPLTLGTPYTGTMSGAQDDYSTSCGYFYRDLVHTFTITAPSDVSIDLDGGSTTTNVSIRSVCTSSASQVRCLNGRPTSGHLRALDAGTYFLVIEGPLVGAYTLTVSATTPPTVPTPATGNDTCGGAILIPPTGGFWSGTTVGALNNYSSGSCDFGGAPANDVTFRLDLAARSRVAATLEGTAFNPILMRFVSTCSGTDVNCAELGSAQLSEMLEPGTYFYVIDGFEGASGTYEFQIFITPTP